MTDYANKFAETVAAVVKPQLQEARPGHCMRLSDLPLQILEILAPLLAEALPSAHICLLQAQSGPEPWRVSPFKVVELRNQAERPLLVLIPPHLRTGAEDSFDVSTFQVLNVAEALSHLRDWLLAEMPDELAAGIRAVLNFCATTGLADEDAVVAYLMTIRHNDYDPECAGGALYELGLLPDFDLFKIPTQLAYRLEHLNYPSVQVLSDPSFPPALRPRNLKVEAGSLDGPIFRLLQSLGHQGARVWSSRLATEGEWRPYSLDQWHFVKQTELQPVQVRVNALPLPMREDGLARRFEATTGRQFKISWETDPAPQLCRDLAYFRIQAVDPYGIFQWESTRIQKGKSTARSRSRLITSDQLQDLEEGLYFFRVCAYSRNGELLNGNDPPRDPGQPDGKRISESEDIWLDRELGEVPTLSGKAPEVQSIAEARFLANMTELAVGKRTVDSEEIKTYRTEEGQARLQYTLVVGEKAYSLVLPSVLEEAQTKILADATYLGGWRIDFTHVNDRAAQRLDDPVPNTPEAQALRQAREVFFTQLHRDGVNCLEVANLLRYRDAVNNLVDAYCEWIQTLYTEDGLMTPSTVLLGDTVELRLPVQGGRFTRAYLLAPTHPLRLLWLTQHALYLESVVGQSRNSPAPTQVLTQHGIEYLRKALKPEHIPAFIPDQRRHVQVDFGALSPFWSLYGDPSQVDAFSIRSLVRRLLGLRGSGSEVRFSTGQVAAHIDRYLRQHPYIRVLKLNAFNPGDGAVIASALLQLDKNWPDLRYDVRLFTRVDNLPGCGTALADLANVDESERAEALSLSGVINHPTRPKLLFSRAEYADFLRKPRDYAAHLAIMTEALPIRVELHPPLVGRGSYLHGLVHVSVGEYASYQTGMAWRKQYPANQCPDPPAIVGAADRIQTLQSAWGMAVSTVATGRVCTDLLPTTVLQLSPQAESLLHTIHEVCDRVITIDRNLGLDYFDREVGTYLLDYAPENPLGAGERLMLTTRTVEEVEELIAPALTEYLPDLSNATQQQAGVTAILQALRSLSGRLGLRLLAAPNQRDDVIGLALVRLFAEQYGLLQKRFLIPLDAHRDWFQRARAEGNPSLSRSDVVMVYLDPLRRHIEFRLVEVKLRVELGGPAAIQALQGEMAHQLENSEDTLRRLFGFEPGRVDQPFRAKELADVLRFYLERALRFRILDVAQVEVARQFLDTLDDGYELSFASTGVVFAFSENGWQRDVVRSHEFYCIGYDLLRRLVTNAVQRMMRGQAVPSTPTRAMELASSPDTDDDVSSAESAVSEMGPAMEDDPSYGPIRTAFDRTLPPSQKLQMRPRPTLFPEDRKYELEVTREDTSPSEDDGGATPQASAESAEIIGGQLESEQVPDSDQAVDKELAATSREPAPPLDSLTSVQEAATATGRVEPPNVVSCDLFLGDSVLSGQFGLLGTASGYRTAVDLDGCNTISLFGVQGGGKSYTVGSIVEMAIKQIPGINVLPSPLAGVIFHYDDSQEYPPEFVSMVHSNDNPQDLTILEREYGAAPLGINDIVLLVPTDKVEERRREYPLLRVEPITFHPTDLNLSAWRFLMSAVTNQSMYIQQMTMIMRRYRGQLTVDNLRRGVEESGLSKAQKELALGRLDLATQFIDDRHRLSNLVTPGRLLIVDLRDELITRDEALGLFVVMLQIFANVPGFNKLIVFDEAHKYMANADLTDHLVGVIRQMRHQGVTVAIASQDPPSLPAAIIELSSMVILHRFNSPAWLKHVQKSVVAFNSIQTSDVTQLRPGEAFVWANKATDGAVIRGPVKVQCRPRVTRHGGGTRRATGESE